MLKTNCVLGAANLQQCNKQMDRQTIVGVEFNASPDTTLVTSETVFIANHLTDTDKQNSMGKYTN